MNNISEKDKRFLNIARLESYTSSHLKAKIGCVLVRNGNIISSGYNKMRHTSNNYSRWDNSLHGEVDCLLKALKKGIEIKNSTLYIFRETRNGKPALCRPCEYCFSMIEELKVKRIVYTTDKFPWIVSEKI